LAAWFAAPEGDGAVRLDDECVQAERDVADATGGDGLRGRE
jgi:hypothetical protein